MVFSSTVFLFAFLPLFLAAYHFTPTRWRTLTILVGSYVFFGWWRYDLLILMVAVTSWSWLCSWAVVKSPDERRRKWALAAGVVGNLSALGYFKYFNFALGNVNAALALADRPPLVFETVILPIGISFYTFQAMSYLIDVYRRDVEPERNILNFSAFIVLFPQLIAGPVLRYKDVVDQFRARDHTVAKFSEGARRFMVGFSMKVLVADVVAPLVDLAFRLDAPTLAEAWMGALAYTAQLYFDFAGYSHMAVGLGLMMGFRFMENFDAPYLSGSITEFWRRWHISLSTWLRDYLYLPLGGNRLGERRTYLNLLLTMLLGGFWHGASWNFFVWGAWHGGLLALERRNRTSLRPGGWENPVGMARTMLAVLLGWVVFRAPDMTVAGGFLAGMAGLNGLELRASTAWQIPPLAVTMTIVAFAIVYGGPLWQRLSRAATVRSTLMPVAVCATFCLATFRLLAMSHSPFLYFQF